MLASFDRVMANGRPELVLVSGYSGIGKSSVVNELHKVLVPPRGLFASGKFDQYKRNIPYSTLAQAFQSLVRPLLAKSEAELRHWRDALREALGPNGLLMVDLVPELKPIIGEQPAVPDLPPQDAKARFQLVFRRFVGVFARSEHPLALFLDDLQWLDAATLDFLEDLLSQPDVHHLMLIGAYRDNEVDSTHPLWRKLDAIRKAGARVARASPGAFDLRRFGSGIGGYPSLRARAGHAAGAPGPREDGRQSIFRHSVYFSTCRRGTAHLRSRRCEMVLGCGSHSRERLHRKCGGPHGLEIESPANRNPEGATGVRLPGKPCHDLDAFHRSRHVGRRAHLESVGG